MANCLVIVCLLLLAIAVRAQAQTVDCHLSRNCSDVFPLPGQTIDGCSAFGGLSYEDDNGVCTDYPVSFGFFQSTFIAEERGEDYSVAVGYMMGSPSTAFQVEAVAVEGSARSSDYLIPSATITIRPTLKTTTLTFLLRVDAVAQEFNETFTIRLVNLPPNEFRPGDTIIDELTVTIIDGDNIEFTLSEDDYRASENPPSLMPVRIAKDQDVTLANPVMFRIIPLTVQQALDQNYISTFQPEDDDSPTRANEQDFNTTSFTVLFPADEDELNIIAEIPAPIQVVDDDIDEAEEQFFKVVLEVVDAVNPQTLLTGARSVAQCIIVDNDIIRIGFALPKYNYTEPEFETLFTNVTIIKDNNGVSEQTFRVTINFGSATGISPATLDVNDPQTSFDYRVAVAGQTTIERPFSPLESFINITFFINSDELPEGTEAFQGTALNTEGFPAFQSPLATSTTAFVSTVICIIDDDIARVGFEQNYTFNEADINQLEEVCVLVFNPPANEELVFDIFLQSDPIPGTADFSDFVVPPLGRSVTFLTSFSVTGERRVCIPFLIIGDDIGEETESFTFVLDFQLGAVQDGVEIDPPITEVFILDDDEVVIGFINAPYEGIENNGSILVAVGLINATQLQREISVFLSYSDGTAVNGSDYLAGGLTIVLGPGNISVPILLPVVDDDTFELTEMLQASLSFPGAPPPRVTINPGLADITIFDDDVLLFGFDNDTYEVEEDAGPARPSVSLMDGNPGVFDIILNVTTDDSSAAATALVGLDYMSLAPGTELTYSSSSATSMPFDVAILPDDLTELTEFFEVIIFGFSVNMGPDQLSLTDQERNRIQFAIQSARIFIRDSDRARIGFIEQNYNESENAGSIDFVFGVLEGNLAFDVNVLFTTSEGTAEADVDYFETMTNFSLLGMEAVMAPVAIINDTDLEGLEYFFGNIEPVANQILDNVDFDPIIARGNIIDDDDVVIGFVPAEYSVNEGDGVITFMIELLVGQLSDNVVVEFYTESGSAEEPGDYNGTVILVTFEPGVTTRTVEVPIVADDLFENDEVFFGNLRLPAGSQDMVMFAPPRANATILDDDSVVIGFIRPYEVTEGIDFMVNIEIAVLDGQLGRDVDVRVFTQDGSAMDPGDYMQNSETLTFTPTQTTFNLTVGIVNDDVVENTESFLAVAELVSTDASAVRIEPNTTTVTILDVDRAIIGFSQSAYDIFEREQVVNVTIVLMGLTDVPLSVILNTRDGTAISSGSGVERDFLPVVALPVIFLPSSNFRQEMVIQITILDDIFVEDNETLESVVSLAAADAAINLNPAEASITIINDDMVVIGFEQNYQVRESDGFVLIRFGIRMGVLRIPVVVFFSTADGSAIAGAGPDGDYIGVDTLMFTFDQDNDTFEVMVPIVDNDIEEPPEYFEALLTSPEDSAILILNPPNTTIQIVDDDSVEFTFRQENYAFNESDGLVTVYVDKIGDTDQTVMLMVAGPLQVETGMTINQVLTFGPNDTTIPVTFTIQDDAIALEPTEMFDWSLMILSPVDDGVTVDPFSTTTISILDDDELTLSLSTPREVNESMNSTACISFSAEFATDFNINAMPSPPENVPVRATPGEDYTAPPATLVADSSTFGPSEPLCFETPIVDDLYVEHEECFAVSISLPSPETDDLLVSIADGEDSTTACIQDDDTVFIGFESDLYTFTEGDPLDLTNITVLILDGFLMRPVTVTLTFGDMTAIGTDMSNITDEIARANDYVDIGPFNITFSENVTSMVILIPIIDNDIHESTEQFSAALASDEDPNVVMIGPNTTIEILDEDEVTFTFRRPMQMLLENVDIATVYIDKMGDSDGPITLNVRGDLQAETGNAIDQQVTFEPDGVFEMAINFTVIDDVIALEPTETLVWTLELAAPVDRASVTPYNTTTIQIIDDDDLVLRLNKSGQVPEAENATACISFSTFFATNFTIMASPAMPENVTVPGIASPGEDYNAPPMNLDALTNMHGPGSDLCFQIPIVADDFVEVEECFAVSISVNATGLMVSIAEGADMSLCCIEDDDRVRIGFEIVDYNADEPDGSVTLRIGVLDGTLQRPAEVSFSTVDGSATSVGVLDFVGLADVPLQFDENTLSLTVTVFIIDDDILENNENFFGNLSTDDPAVDLDPSLATVEIFDIDDDITVGFVPTEYVVGEADGQAILFVEILNGTLERNVTVRFETSPGTATEAVPADYEGAAFLLTFAPGIDRVAAPVNIINDDIVEGNETFFGNLDNQGQPVIVDPPREQALVVITEDVNDQVTIGFEETLYLAEEGDVVEVCAVLLSGTLERDVLVTASSTDDTAMATEDYLPIMDEELTFNADTDRMCFNVSVLEDNLLEPEENFMLNLETDDPMVLLLPEEAEVRINDTNRITVGLEEMTYFGDEEDGFIMFCVVIVDGTVARDAVVTVTSTDGTATSVGNVDFEAVNVDLTFMAGMPPRICENVTVLDDAIYENPEDFILTLSTTDPSVDVDPDREVADVTINDFDEITIGFVSDDDFVFEEMPGYIDICVEVKNGGMLERNATVMFSTADGSATAGEDYDSTTMLLTFSMANQNTPECVRVPITNDNDTEGVEDFTGILVTDEDRVILEPNTTVIRILDDDIVRVGFINDPYSAPEESEFATLIIQVMGELGTELLVNLTTEDIAQGVGYAKVDVDYIPVQTVLVFNENVRTIEINVTLIDDGFLEGNEDFLARLEILTPGSIAELVPDDNAIVTILDNDRVVIGMDETVVNVNEDIGQRELCASLMSGELMKDVDVMVVFEDRSAMDPEDYLSDTITLTFSPSVNRSCFNVTIVDDDRYELREDFFVNLTTTQFLTTIMPMTTVVMIDDEDVVTIGWELPLYNVSEGDGSVEICAVVLEGAANIGSTLPIINILTEDGTAISGDDYNDRTNPRSFDFQSGNPDRMCADVTIFADSVFEDTENLFADLSVAPTPRVILDPSRTQIDIMDINTVVIGFDPSAYEVDEGAGVITLVVAVLNGTLNTEVEVRLTTQDDEAVSSGSDPDFEPLDITLTLSPSEMVIRVNVTINDDTIDELNELFNANLTLITDNDRVTVTPEMAEVLIVDNDMAILGFEMPRYSIAEVENDTSVIEVCVVLMPPPTLDRTVTVMLGSMDGTAQAPEDYVPVMANLTFDADTDRQCVNVTVNGDDIVEGTENVSLVLESDDDVLLLPEEAEVQILDTGMILVEFAEPLYTFNEEDGTGTIELVKSGSTSEPFMVRVFGGPSNQTDIVRSANGIDTVVEFQKGPSAPASIFIDFVLTDDEIGLEAVEAYEVFLEIVTLMDLVQPGNQDTTEVNVLDPDVVNVGFGRPSVSVNESDGQFMMCVVKDRETVVPVTVVISTSSGTATEGDDYDPANVPGNVTIPANANMSCFTSDSVIDDEYALEEDETFLLLAEELIPDDDRINVSPENTTVIILDDDVPVIGFEETMYTVVENDTVPTEVCVSVMPPLVLVGTVTVMLRSTDGTAEAPMDYDTVATDLVFDADNSRHCVNVTASPDDIVEGTENFTLSLDSDDNVVLLPEEARVDILDSGMILVEFAEPIYTFNEEDGTGRIELVKSGSTSEPFTVRVIGGPSNQTDIVRSADGIDTVVEFQAGPSAPNSIFIDFDLTDDEIGLEAVEAYVVSLEILTLMDLVQPGNQDMTEVNVLDPDVVNVGFGRPSVSVNESDGQFMMCVVKDRETVVPVTVVISTSSGTATEGDDYDPANVPGNVTIPANANMSCFTSDSVIDDEIALEEDETFLLLAEELVPDDDRINVSPENTTVTILDEDVATVRFALEEYVFDESLGVAVVCLIKDAETAESFTVDDITTTDGTATEGSDYAGGPYNVTFEEAPDDTQCIMIPLVVDSISEGSEDFTVNLNLPAAGLPNVQAGDPESTRVIIEDPDDTIFVNDTVIGDPLFTVPILVAEEQLQALNLSELSLCYEIHGRSDQWFNLVTDECTSVNGRYGEFNADLNVIDEIAVRAVDDADQCVNIRVDVANCTADVNGVSMTNRYSMNGISVRRYRNRVRISVPNCNDLTLVMWVFCETRTLEDFVTGDLVTGDMIKFVVMRGLNVGRSSHGLLGQFWNIPVSIAPYEGQLRSGEQSQGRFVVNITTTGMDPAQPRSYTGWLYDLTWEFNEGPCLYVGNRQGGPIYEVANPNDNVIEESYKEYQVDSAFSEEGYDFGIFMEDRCAISSSGSAFGPTTSGPPSGPTQMIN